MCLGSLRNDIGSVQFARQIGGRNKLAAMLFSLIYEFFPMLLAGALKVILIGDLRCLRARAAATGCCNNKGARTA